MISLREFEENDLKIIFEQQLDTEANFMAAFTHKDPTDFKRFSEHWKNNLSKEDTTTRIIIYDGRNIGYVAAYNLLEELHIGYWIDKKYWGKGIATEAVQLFLKIVATRPLKARVAFDNCGSIKVLEKCGFKLCGEDEFFAYARQKVIKELIYELSI